MLPVVPFNTKLCDSSVSSWNAHSVICDDVRFIIAIETITHAIIFTEIWWRPVETAVHFPTAKLSFNQFINCIISSECDD